jgi:hypothetical protein
MVMTLQATGHIVVCRTPCFNQCAHWDSARRPIALPPLGPTVALSHLKQLFYYDCRLTASLVRAGFFEALNHNVRIQRIFAPPQTRPEGTPENVSCEWLISLD